MHLDRDVVPESFVYRESDWCSACVKSTTEPSFVAAAESCEPTTSAGSIWTCDTDTTSDGAPAGWMSMREPNVRPSITTSSIARTVPSTGAYTSVPAGAPISNEDVDGPCPPGSWYQRGEPVDEPKIAWTTRFSTPSFACVPSGDSASAPEVPPW